MKTFKKITMSLAALSLFTAQSSSAYEYYTEYEKDATIAEKDATMQLQKEPSYSSEKTTNLSLETTHNGSFFIEFNLGATVASLSNNYVNGFFQKGVDDDTSSMIDLGFGHYFTENIFTTLNYQSAGYDLSTISNTSISLNYEWAGTTLRPYVGVVLGYSSLEWDVNPILITETLIPSSESFMFGIQAGISYEIDNNFSLVTKIQYLSMDHKTEIDLEKLQVDSQVVGTIGVRYKF